MPNHRGGEGMSDEVETRSLGKSENGEEQYVSFWKAGDHYRLQTNSPQLARRIQTWSFAKETAWGVNSYLRIFVVPIDKSTWIRKQLGFPSKARSPTQEQVTQKLIKQGHAYRFHVNENGQEN